MMSEHGRIGGWQAPCAAFDYGKMEREAQKECEVLEKRLRDLKSQKGRDAEAELVRRREICMLTDIYYEQRHQARLFHKRAGQREKPPLSESRGISDRFK